MYLMIRWCISLGMKFARVVPLRTLWIVGLTIASQLSRLAAFLLPLKVVMMLGSERIPRYFPAIFLEFDRNVLVLCLGAATICAFISHLLFEKSIAAITAKGSALLLQRSHKMMLFEGQDSLAASAYERFSRAVAGWVFVLLLGSVMGWLYPKLVLTMLAVVGIACGSMFFTYRFSATYRDDLAVKLKNGVALWANLVFFAAFGFLLADFSFGSPPTPIIAVLSILLLRQLLGRLSSGVTDFYSLWVQRPKLDALFFHGKTLLPTIPEVHVGFWSFLQPKSRGVWLPQILADLLDEDIEVDSHSWLASGGAGLVNLRVVANKQAYLVRVFNKNKTVQANHEAVLMLENIPNLPALPWVGMTVITDYPCLVYKLPEGGFPQGQAIKVLAAHIQGQLLQVKFSKAFMGHYARSKPALWQRLNTESVERLLVCANAEEQAMVHKLVAGLPLVLEHLKKLPLGLVLPHVGATHLWLLDAEKNQGVAMQWVCWSLEPLGAGWVRTMHGIGGVEDIFLEIKKLRPDLADLELDEIKLSAYLFWLEELCQAENLAVAMELLPHLLEVAQPYLDAHSGVKILSPIGAEQSAGVVGL